MEINLPSLSVLFGEVLKKEVTFSSVEGASKFVNSVAEKCASDA